MGEATDKRTKIEIHFRVYFVVTKMHYDGLCIEEIDK